MGAEAIRAYLSTLREARQMSQQRIADKIGVTRVSWQRYENGETKDPQSSFLISALRALGGSFDHLRQLAEDRATRELGARLAAQRIEEEQALGELEALRATMSDDEVDALLAARERELEDELNRLRGRRGGGSGR